MICLVFGQIVFILANIYNILNKGGGIETFLYLFVGIILTIAAFTNMVKI